MKKMPRVLTPALLGTMLLVLASVQLYGDNRYRDPQGRFTLTVPAGWTQTATSGSVTLTQGDAFSMLLPFRNVSTGEEILSSVVNQITSQSKDMRQVSKQQETIGGQPAAFEGIVGINPKGIQSFYGLYGVVANGQGYAVIQVGPISQFSVLAKDMDQIAHSIQFAGGDSGSSSRQNAGPSSGSFVGQPPQGENTSSSPEEGIAFESPDHSVSFPTPAGWTVRTVDGNGSPYYVLEREGGQERILAANGPATGSIQEVAQQGMQLVSQIMPGLRPASRPTYSEMSGAPLATISYAGNVQGVQVTGWHLITIQNGQFFGALGLASSDQSRMIQQTCHEILRGVRLKAGHEGSGVSNGQNSPNNASGLIGSWEWYKSTEVGTPRTGSHCSTEKLLSIYANGRYDYTASTYCPNMPTDVDPTTRISGTYKVTGNTIVGRADNGQTATYRFRLLQGGQVLEIGGDQYIRK